MFVAKRLGAERIIILGRHESRLEIARRFGYMILQGYRLNANKRI